MTIYIDAGIGQIKASSDNLKLQILLESLKEKIESGEDVDPKTETTTASVTAADDLPQ